MSLFSDARKARIERARNTPDSRKAYLARRAAVQAKAAQLQALLAKFDEQASADQANWGYAGSLAHVEEQLDNLIEGFQ